MIPSQTNAALYHAYIGKSVDVEKMPISLWLFHKGPLILCCLFIVLLLLLPQTHTYSTLLLSAIYGFFSFLMGPVVRKVQGGNRQGDRGGAFLHPCCDVGLV